MPIRMTGLNSGLNTESIIAALMSAQRTKQTKVESKKTKLEWKQEVWSSLNTKIYDFYKNALSKIRMQATYKTKVATSSNISKVTAKASSSAATGSYAITVNQIATAQSVTSGRLRVVVRDELGNPVIARDVNGNTIKDETGNNTYEYTNASYTSKTKLIDLESSDGNPAFTEFTQIKVGTKDSKGNETVVYLNVDSDTTIQNFVDKLKSAGLNASFDEKQQRFFISSTKSGKDNSFTISAGTMSDGEDGQKAVSNRLKEIIGYDSLSTDDRAKADNLMAGLQSGRKTFEDVIDQFTTFANNKTEKDAKRKATDFYTAIAKNEQSAELDKAVRESQGLSETDEITVKHYAKYLNDNGYKIDTNESDTTELEEVVNEAKDKYLDKKAAELLKKSDYKKKINDAVSGGIDENLIKKELGIVAGAVIDATTQATIDEYKSKYALDDVFTRTGNSNEEVIKAVGKYESVMSGGVTADTEVLKSLGLNTITDDNITDLAKKSKNITNDTEMAVVEAKDTVITYNGAVINSDTTNVSVGGLELNILSETVEGETINISVTNDTSAIYDTIKDFLSEYNSILAEMSKYYSADSAKGYSVLTDDEKDTMSESEIEKWESKIKDSLLRRDTMLSSIISSFRNNMMGTYTAANGRKFALSSIGILTSADYKEGGMLHILGDEDDSEYADKDNLLKKMLEENPDIVMQLFTKLSDNLYQDLQKKMSSNKLSGAFTFYNDKEMSSQLSDYKKDISKWQDKLNQIEDKYYKQFTAMEKALANMQSQQNSLASLLGN